MIKILVKAAILVCIILSIYFIVNPSACSNLINGRVVNSMDTVPVSQQHRTDQQGREHAPRRPSGPHPWNRYRCSSTGYIQRRNQGRYRGRQHPRRQFRPYRWPARSATTAAGIGKQQLARACFGVPSGTPPQEKTDVGLLTASYSASTGAPASTRCR